MFTLFLINKSFAVNNQGAATEYKITMTLLELCAAGSTDTTCLNPIVVGSGSSGLIDIANTSAGAAAASYGDFQKAPFNKSYPRYQVTMKRQITIAGSVSDGENTCKTSGDDSSISTAVKGKTAGDPATVTLYMAQTVSGMEDYLNSTSAGDGSGVSQDPGTIDDDDEYIEYRGSFTQPIILKPGKIPTLMLAFGTSSALGYIGESGECTTNGAEQQGLYGAEPDVTATIIY